MLRGGAGRDGAERAATIRRHRTALLAVLVALAGGVTMTGCTAPVPVSPPAAGPAPAPADPAPQRSVSPLAPAVSPTPLRVGEPPASVTIPAIELTEPLVDLGLLPDGSMEVPDDFGAVGWFTGGGRPGGIGPTVIAGHVDSTSGPAIFARLGELGIGDQVQVTDVAGAVFTYAVYRAEDYPKSEFPTAEVFGAMPTDEVRLITCSGSFDTSIGHYDDNRIVYAKPV